MKYLKNVGKVLYEIKGYNKINDVMTLIDPHTGEEFKLHNYTKVKDVAGYKLVKLKQEK